MRQWLVWCLHEKLGDTELELFNDRHSSRGRRRIVRQQNQRHSSCSSQQNDHHSLDNDDESNLGKSPPAIVQLDSLSSSPLLLKTPTSAPSLLVPLVTSIPASNPRLVRQHAVHERSPRASYSGEGGNAFLDAGTIGQSRQHGRLQSSPATGRGHSMPSQRNGFESDDPSRRSNAYIGSRHRVVISTSTGVTRMESGGERLTVNDASYSGGSSFESYGSTG